MTHRSKTLLLPRSGGLQTPRPRTRLERLHADCPGAVERALDEQHRVSDHLNVFVDGESIRAGAGLGLHTPVRCGTQVWIISAVSGG